MRQDEIPDARNFRYLHEIERRGGVRAAADALGINPSVISRQVSQLEQALQLLLLERKGRQVVLTEIALGLVEYFRDNRRRELALVTQLQQFRDLRRGKVKIAAGEGFVDSLLARALKSFSLEYPHITIELRSGSTEQIIEMVRNDDVEFALCVGETQDPAMRVKALRTAPLCALVTPDHMLAQSGARSIGVQALVGEKLIFFPSQFGNQQYLNAMLLAEGLELTPTYRCDLFSAAQAIAAQGLGVAFMSTDAARQSLDTGRLVALELDHPIARRFRNQAIRRVGRRLSKAAGSLWRKMEEAGCS